MRHDDDDWLSLGYVIAYVMGIVFLVAFCLWAIL